MSSYANAAGGAPIGAYRNLTAAFLRYRDATRSHSRPYKGANAELTSRPDGASRRLLPQLLLRTPGLLPSAVRLPLLGGARARARKQPYANAPPGRPRRRSVPSDLSACAEEKGRAGEGARLLDGRVSSSSEVELAVGGGSVAISLPPEWVKYSEDATTTMGRIRDRLAQLATLHARALLPNFDEFSGEDAKVDVLTQEITHLFKRCEKGLTALAGQKSGDEGDIKVRQNVVRAMAAELQKLSVDFRKKQKDYLQKLKLTQDRGPGGDVFGDVPSGDGAGGEGEDYGFTDRQILQTNTLIDEVVARDQEVVKIIESVNELAAIMKDLSVLVIDQGTILDRIDYNVEQVSEKVADGVKQLEAAEKTQKRSLMFIIISLLFVLVLVMILFVAGKMMLRSG